MSRARSTVAALLSGLGLAAACDRGSRPAPIPAVTAPPAAASSVPPATSVTRDASPGDAVALDGTLPDDAGDADAPEAATGCPPEMARINRYCIDRWEARLVARGDDGVLTPHPHSHRPVPGLIAESAPDVFPQGYISRVEAAAACYAA